MKDIVQSIIDAKKASIDMAVLTTDVKNDALEAMAKALDDNRTAILEANGKDLKESEGNVSNVMYKRLMIDDSKIDGMIAGIRDVIKLDDPVGEQMSALDLDDDLTLYQIRCPIGMLGVIFESRPDVVPQIMSLCLKSGNSVAFKGGREALNSIQALFTILRDAASSKGVPEDAFVLMETRDDISSILGMHEHIDLLIPRGSNQFVKYIQDNTKIPVLGHAAGICHIYVDPEYDEKKALDVILDSKIQYPAVCNAMETLLVHRDAAEEFLPKMIPLFKENGVEVRGDDRVREIVPDIEEAVEEDWDTEYGDYIVSVKVVNTANDAIDFINRHGSHHTDAIITENRFKAALFAGKVDSADVFINASTRFADGFRFGKGAEVGISTNKIHSRGPVGMEGIMIYKYVLVGNGQVVKDYVGKDAKKFKHEPSKRRYPYE